MTASFWHQLQKPIIGLSPMDGVTDPCFRRMMAMHGRPDIIMTEFLSAEGICHGARNALMGLAFHEVERPVIAQIYGPNPETFFHVAQLVCELGFDGLDINMGCPSKKVSALGSGAALILDPPRAKAIIQAAKEGIARWVSGAPLSICETYPVVGEWLLSVHAGLPEKPVADREPIPVSVKTRIGYDDVVIETWMRHLLEARPAAISIHGRTLRQKYRGEANWEMIARAVEIAQDFETLILGNGDLQSMKDVIDRVRQTGVDGVLIGRAAVGNPWVFHRKEIARAILKSTRAPGAGEDLERLAPKPIPYHERFYVALQHAKLYQAMYGERFFNGMRKHLGSYCRGFAGARAIRAKIVRTNNVAEVEDLIKTHLAERFAATSLEDDIVATSEISLAR